MTDPSAWFLLLWLPGAMVPLEPFPVAGVQSCQSIVAHTGGHGDCIDIGGSGAIVKVYPGRRYYGADPHKPYLLCQPSLNNPATINCDYGKQHHD